MNEKHDQELLDAVAASYSSAGLIRVEAAPAEALHWIHGRLCVNGSPVIRMPVVLADSLGVCSVAYRELLLSVRPDCWIVVTAMDEEYEFVNALMKPFDAFGGLPVAENWSPFLWGNGFERERILTKDPEKLARRGLRHHLSDAQQLFRRSASVGFGAAAQTLNLLFHARDPRQRAADAVAWLTNVEAKYGDFCFAPSFITANREALERIRRTVQQQISWEEARFNLFSEGIYTLDNIEILDGRLYWRGLEISRFFPIYELEKGVIGRGRSEGREEPVYFYLGRDAAEAVFKGQPMKYEGSFYSLISELIDVIEEFPTDCDKSKQYFKDWLESAVERAAKSLREDVQTGSEEYGRSFDYETFA